MKRVDVKAILRDPKLRAVLLARAVESLRVSWLR